MQLILAAASAAALMAIGAAMPAMAQEGESALVGPPFPAGPPSPRTGLLPASLDLGQAIEEAVARSPTIVAAQAEVDAARARLRQAGFRPNPELSVEVENFAGTGPYSGFNGTETTVSVDQRLDLGGRRRARMGLAEAELAAQELRLAITRADLERDVRVQFAMGLAAKARLELATRNQARAGELARIADELVAAGREPPLRGLRARAAAAQADAALRAAEAEELAARRTLAASIGVDTPPQELRPSGAIPPAAVVRAIQTLDVRLAEAERVIAEAGLRRERAAARLDPSVGVGVREIRETSDRALVARLSVPLPLFDRNQGNIAAAESGITAAVARRNRVLANAEAEIRNASAALAAAEARVDALEKAALPQAEEAFRLADLSYRAGRTALIELLDAQEAFAAAQSELIEARLARDTAAATLARAAAGQGAIQ